MCKNKFKKAKKKKKKKKKKKGRVRYFWVRKSQKRN